MNPVISYRLTYSIRMDFVLNKNISSRYKITSLYRVHIKSVFHNNNFVTWLFARRTRVRTETWTESSGKSTKYNNPKRRSRRRPESRRRSTSRRTSRWKSARPGRVPEASGNCASATKWNTSWKWWPPTIVCDRRPANPGRKPWTTCRHHRPANWTPTGGFCCNSNSVSVYTIYGVWIETRHESRWIQWWTRTSWKVKTKSILTLQLNFFDLILIDLT